MNPTPHGKIFRLPHHIREQIHIRRLRDAPDDARHWKLLRALCRDVVDLRRPRPDCRTPAPPAPLPPIGQAVYTVNTPYPGEPKYGKFS
ncbi:MAG: hypothetical protein ABSA47_07975 [Verrucomicrobiota bacterium]|jgi:hypothetical protein